MCAGLTALTDSLTSRSGCPDPQKNMNTDWSSFYLTMCLFQTVFSDHTPVFFAFTAALFSAYFDQNFGAQLLVLFHLPNDIRVSVSIQNQTV